jgi:hypothetical protein
MLLELHRNLRLSVNPRFELELLLSRLARVQGLVTPDELLAEVNAIKGQFEADRPAAPAAAPSAGSAAGPEPAGTPATAPRSAPQESATASARPAGVPVRGRPAAAAPPPAVAAPATMAQTRRGTGAAALPDTAPARRTAEREPPEPPTPAAAPPAGDGLLPAISEQIRGQNQLSLAASLERALSVEVSGDQVTVTFGVRERYSGEHVIGEQRVVAAAATAVVGRPVTVKVAYRRDGEQPGAGAASGGDVERFRKVFRGEVVKEASYGT